MISREDCIALCGLDRAQVVAIAEHEEIPEVEATALANYLLHKRGGEKEIARMMIEDIHAAMADGRTERAAELFGALRQFINQHPAAVKDSAFS